MTTAQRKKQLHRRLAIAGVVLLAAVAAMTAIAIYSGDSGGSGNSTASGTAPAQSTAADIATISDSDTGTDTNVPISGIVSASSDSALSGAANAQSVGQTTSAAQATVTPAAVDTGYEEHIQAFLADPDGFYVGGPDISRQDLTINPYSRPGEAMPRVDDIVVHSTDSPGASAQNVRDYFESLTDGSRSASSHFVVGLDGEIIECIPVNEKSYATRWRNYDTVSIECCSPDENGTFNQATYDSCIRLVAWLEYKLGLSASHVIRHYDVTGKNCPRYFAANEDAWTQFKADVETQYNAIAAAGGVVQ